MEDKFYAYALLFITLKYVTGVREFVETLRNPLRPVITGVFGIFPFAEFIKPPSIFPAGLAVHCRNQPFAGG